MKVEVQVISEETRSWQGKTGPVQALSLCVLDLEKSPGCRFKQTFDYELRDHEKDRYAGKLVDKRVTLGITDFSVFAGRYRATGTIVQVLDK